MSVDKKDQELFSFRLEDQDKPCLCYYMASEQSIYKYDPSTKKAQLLTVLKFPLEDVMSVGQDNQCFVYLKSEHIQYIPEIECKGDGWYLLDPVVRNQEEGSGEKIANLAHFVAPGALAGRTFIAYDEQSKSFINITTNQTFKANVSFDFFQSMRTFYEEIDETSFYVRFGQQLFRQAQINIDFRAYQRSHHDITCGRMPVPFVLPQSYRHFCRPICDRDGYVCTGELCQYICDKNYFCLGKTYDKLAALGF